MTNTKKRILLSIACVLCAIIFLIAAILVAFFCVWGNEAATVMSFKQLQTRNDGNKEGSVYRMDVSGGFYFDDFLAGGGASTDKELISFITKNITKGLIKMEIGETDIGCSSFTAKTPDGDVLFARNYDFDKTNVCITLCKPDGDRHASFSTVDLNYVGMDVNSDVTGLMNKITCLAAPYAPLDGINDAGVSCGIYMSYQGGTDEEGTVATNQNDPEKDNITSTTMLRMVLDYADDVDEAVALIKKYNLHDSANTSFHYMIADATGKSAILEWLPANGTDATDNDGTARVLNVTYNTDAMYNGLRADGAFGFQWITNFIVRNHETYYTDNSAKPGYDRYEYIYGKLNESNGILTDENAAMDILAGVGRRSWGAGDGCTVHSAVYNLTDKTVLWVANEHYGDKTVTYQYSLKTGKLTTVA